MGRRENLMCHKTALVYGFSKIDAKFKPNWKFKQKNAISDGCSKYDGNNCKNIGLDVLWNLTGWLFPFEQAKGN